MSRRSGSHPGDALVIAAFLLGAAIVGASYWVRAEIRATNAAIGQQIAAVRSAAIRASGGTPAPDPRRRHEVEVGDAPVRGPADAAVTLALWADFECPFCQKVVPTLAKVRETWPDDVRIVWKHMPLPMHRRARDAHRAAEAAHRQGRFWEMHDRIAAEPEQLSLEACLAHAQAIGLDLDRFRRDLADPELDARIEADIAEASALGVQGTPSFFVNGRFLLGARPFSDFEARIEEELDAR